MCRELRRAHSVRLKIIYVFKQGVITDMAGKVLVVDDEKMIVKGIKFSLIQDYSVVDCAYDGEEALNMAKNNDYDIILLDIMLPKMNGLEVCQQIREFSNVPIIMLTAKDGEVDTITGLTLGADDYVTKPFKPLALMARVKAQLRRYKKYNSFSEPMDSEGKETIITTSNGLVMNISAHVCIVDGTSVELTPTEFKILQTLCEKKGLAVMSEELFRSVWPDEFYDKNSNTITVHIRHLREKMGDTTEEPRYIKTIWGVGYKVES